MGKKLSSNIFKPTQSPQPKGNSASQGGVGFDNPRENIDPHIKTQAISTKEEVVQDLKVDHIAERTASHDVVIDNDIQIKNISFIDDTTSGIAYSAARDQLQIIIAGSVIVTFGVTTTVYTTDIEAENIFPTITNTYDLGTTSFKWKDLHLAGDATVDEFIMTNPLQDYKFTKGGGNYDSAMQSQTSGRQNRFELYTKDGDGTDHCQFNLYGYGTPSAFDPRHLVIFGWDKNAGYYKISTAAVNLTNKDLVLSALGKEVRILTGTDFTVEDEATVASKIKMTALGGYAIKLTNKTGSNTVAGQLVAVYTTTAIDDAFVTCSASDDNVIGIVLDAGVADGSEAWVVVSGIADVLMDAGGSARGDRLISSATAGSADVWNTGGAVATHFLEIGHCIETRTGAGLARAVLHFL